MPAPKPEFAVLSHRQREHGRIETMPARLLHRLWQAGKNLGFAAGSAHQPRAIAMANDAPAASGFAAVVQAWLEFWHGARVARRSSLVSAVNDSGLTGATAAINERITAGDWIRIAPFGQWPNEVGLQIFDRVGAEAMIGAFNTAATEAGANWKGLPVYEGHPDDPAWRSKNPGYKRLALGRVKELQTREDGLYGRVALNDQGNALVRGDAPAYEAQSPRWGMMKTTFRGGPAFRPVELRSLGLTNEPNIPGTHLGLNEREETFPPMHKIKLLALLAALGRPLAADSNDTQLETAANEAIAAAPAILTASNELGALKPKLTTAENEVSVLTAKLKTADQLAATLKADAVNERNARIETVLTNAVNTGRVKPAEREGWKTKLVAATAVNEFTALETEIGKLKVAVNTQNHVKTLGGRKPEELASLNRISAINEAVEQKKKANPNLDHSAAYLAVQREKPDLFVTTSA